MKACKSSATRLFIDGIQQKIQTEWTDSPPSLLKNLKPKIEMWSTANRANRREEVVIARLRLGHTLVTHRHLFARDPTPSCLSFNQPTTILHLLDDCLDYKEQRQKIFGREKFPVHSHLDDREESVSTVLTFVRATGLYENI